MKEAEIMAITGKQNQMTAWERMRFIHIPKISRRMIPLYYCGFCGHLKKIGNNMAFYHGEIMCPDCANIGHQEIYEAWKRMGFEPDDSEMIILPSIFGVVKK